MTCSSIHVHNVQEILRSLPKENPTLLDGLTVYDLLKKVDASIATLSRQTIHSRALRREKGVLKKVRADVLSRRDLATKVRSVERWIRAGYDRRFIQTDPASVNFFGEADFRPIQVFKNGMSQLASADMDLHFDHTRGAVLFKVEGEWTPYEEIKERITFDPVEREFVGWTYVHPEGFVPVDPSHWTTLRPYAKLSETAHRTLQEVARQFWNKNQPEIDPGVDKPCVLQVLVVNRNFNKPSSWSVKNLSKITDPHCQIRVVDEKGFLYSFGPYVSKRDLAFVTKNTFPFFTLRTANVRFRIPDREELSTTHGDVVSIPVSLVRWEAIQKKVESINRLGSSRFCMSNRNCAVLAKDLLALGGVQVDTRMTITQLLTECLPSASDVPYVGRPLMVLVRVISALMTKVHDAYALLPLRVKHVIVVIWQVLVYIPEKIGIVVCSIIFLMLGAGRGNKDTSCRRYVEGCDSTHQQALITSFGDLFRRQTLEINHPNALRKWIVQQGGYQRFDNTAPRLNILSDRR